MAASKKSRPHLPQVDRVGSLTGPCIVESRRRTVLVTVPIRGRFTVVDVYYPPTGGGRAALVVATDRRFAALVDEQVAWLDHVTAYQPGRFVTRELPPIAGILAHAGRLDLLVIDGYVDLDPTGAPGLGAHLHAQSAVPVFRGGQDRVSRRRPRCHGPSGHRQPAAVRHRRRDHRAKCRQARRRDGRSIPIP